MHIEEILKWEHKLQNLENFVALQIIKNILTDSFPKDVIKNQLVTLMKIYSVRAVFESCHTINSARFDLKKVEDKCQDIINKNKERFKESF